MKARYLFPDDYMADLSVHVFNGRLYIYTYIMGDYGSSAASSYCGLPSLLLIARAHE